MDTEMLLNEFDDFNNEENIIEPFTDNYYKLKKWLTTIGGQFDAPVSGGSMTEVIGTCGHKLRGIDDNMLTIKDHFNDYNEWTIKRCIAYVCVCDKCAKEYEEMKIVLHNQEEIDNWLNESQCQWIKEVEEGVYETDCKHSFQFISDGVKENHFNHCPYCGKPIIEIDLTEDYGRFDEESDKQAEGL